MHSTLIPIADLVNHVADNSAALGHERGDGEVLGYAQKARRCGACRALGGGGGTRANRGRNWCTCRPFAAGEEFFASYEAVGPTTSECNAHKLMKCESLRACVGVSGCLGVWGSGGQR